MSSFSFVTENPSTDKLSRTINYITVVFFSVFLPAYMPPIVYFKKWEQRLRLEPRFSGNDETALRSFPRGLFRAFSNFFLVLRGFKDSSCFLLIIYPLHSIVNLITLILVSYYDEQRSHKRLMHGVFFEENHKLVVFILGLAGFANLIMMPFFLYRNIGQVLIKLWKKFTCKRETTYIVNVVPLYCKK